MDATTIKSIAEKYSRSIEHRAHGCLPATLLVRFKNTLSPFVYKVKISKIEAKSNLFHTFY